MQYGPIYAFLNIEQILYDFLGFEVQFGMHQREMQMVADLLRMNTESGNERSMVRTDEEPIQIQFCLHLPRAEVYTLSDDDLGVT